MQLSQEISVLASMAALPWLPSGHGIASGQVMAPRRAPLPSPVQVPLPLDAAGDADASQGKSRAWGRASHQALRHPPLLAMFPLCFGSDPRLQ